MLAGFGHWPASVAFGLIAALLLIALFGRRYTSIKLMDWTVLTYFGLAAVATFVFHIGGFRTYNSVVVWTLYAAGAWSSILLRQPFTLQYARETAPPDRWQAPAFLRTNMIISAVWGSAFLINLAAVTIALDPRFDSLWIEALLPVLTLIAASVFTTRYARAARAQHP